MKITYDSSVDAAYIEFKSAKEVTTIRLTEGCHRLRGKRRSDWHRNFKCL